MPQNLIEYINNNLASGIPKPAIEESLLQSGWQKEQIDQAFLQSEISIVSTRKLQSRGYENNPPDSDLPTKEGSKSPLFKISLFASVVSGIGVANVLFVLYGWYFLGVQQSIEKGNVLTGVIGILFGLVSIFAPALLPLAIVLSIFRKKRRFLVINILIIVVLVIITFSLVFLNRTRAY